MRILVLFFSISMAISGAEAFACGHISGCTGGVSVDENGNFYISTQFTIPTSDYIQVASGNVIELDRLSGNSWGATFTDGHIKVYPIRPSTQGPPAPVLQFPSGVSTRNMPYTYYVRKDYYLASNESSNTPAGEFVYTGVTCNGSCVLGNLDSVAQARGGVTVSGWACDRLQRKSIRVDVYAGGPAGTKNATFIGSAVAERASSVRISAMCGTSGVPHRFRFSMAQSVVNAHRRQKIWVHGISESSTPNSAITNSGVLRVPNPMVIGSILNPTSSAGVVHIKGWACEEGIAPSIKVQLFVGGPAGAGGSFLTEMAASLPSDGTIAKECGTNGRNYKFDFALGPATVERLKGKPIFIHGISRTGGMNLVLDRSGLVRVP